jgi:hypothetical protein
LVRKANLVLVSSENPFKNSLIEGWWLDIIFFKD